MPYQQAKFISGTNLLRQFDLEQHRARHSISAFLSHQVTICLMVRQKEKPLESLFFIHARSVWVCVISRVQPATWPLSDRPAVRLLWQKLQRWILQAYKIPSYRPPLIANILYHFQRPRSWLKVTRLYMSAESKTCWLNSLTHSSTIRMKFCAVMKQFKLSVLSLHKNEIKEIKGNNCFFDCDQKLQRWYALGRLTLWDDLAQTRHDDRYY